MADKQDTVYNSKQLSKWFAISSLILLVIVVWALIEDYDRPWKQYQRQSQKIVAAIGEQRLKAAEAAMKKSKLDGKVAELEEKLKEVEAEEAEVVREIDKKIKDLSDDYSVKNQEFQNLKGVLLADLFILEKAIEHEDPKANRLKAAYDKKNKEVKKLQIIAEDAEKKLDHAKNMKLDILSREKEIADRRDKLTKELNTLKKQIFDNEANLPNIIRNAPLIDFVAPTIKINQIILSNLKDDYFFNKVGRVDRCMTCHVTADKAGFEDFPQPFTTHPKLKLMVGADSPHPASKVGCTGCHSGVPQSVDFANSAHTPRNKIQEQAWAEKYHFHRNHHIKTHMLPVQMTEGKCLQCHASQTQLDGAPTFNAGMRLIERYGCYNCHKFAGHFEKLALEKKSGPQLNNIASKLTPEWVIKWLWNPKSFRPTTLMPAFWQVHNNSDPDSIERGKVEVESIAYFLFKKAEPFEPIKLASNSVGDAEKGKELVGSIGCLGCHAVADFPRKNPSSPLDPGWKDPIVPLPGPELNQMGSKVSREWLTSWLINPKHYWEQTIMPSMKLSEKEAIDIAEYLLSKKNERFEALDVPVAKDEVRDQLVTDYFRKKLSPKEAAVKLASMSLDEKKNFLGEKFISHYGCYACHAIKGFEKAPNLGAELTEEGSKDVSKFAFENVHLDHTSRPDWIYTKVRTPRIWDVGKIRDFEAKAKMPHFGLTHKQAEAVAAVVLGHENSNVEAAVKFPVDGRWEQIIAGQRVINRYNCVGCHAIEKGKGGHILAYYQDDLNMGPPNLHTEGSKVQPDWLHAYLLNTNVKIRPWHVLRMPTFQMTNEEATILTKYFAAYDQAPYPFFKKVNSPLSSEELKAAGTMFGQLACLSCHGEGVDLSTSAPNLKNVKARLRPEWVVRWIKDPNAIMPGTRMPQLWPPLDPDDPKSAHVALPGFFEDDAHVQMQKIRDYVFQYGGAPTLPPAPTYNPDRSSTPPAASK
ncbi:MAG: c-type cytochrome [Bdellovibrionota bacterium]